MTENIVWAEGQEQTVTEALQQAREGIRFWWVHRVLGRKA